MNTFTDFVRDKHFNQYEWQEESRGDDFENWKERINNDNLSRYLIDYTNTLWVRQYAWFAYSILQSNN